MMRLTRLAIFYILCSFSLQLICMAEQSADYDIGIGDRLKIMMPSTSTKNLSPDNVSLFGDYTITTYTADINNEGYITLPIIGLVKAGGLSIRELQTKVKQMVENGLKKQTTVNIALEFSERKYAYISGNVKNPGKYHFTSPFSLFDLLASAGGISDFGVIDITISRKGKDINITSTNNVMLSFRDSVFVKPLEKNIYLSGEFKKPGSYSLDYESVPLQQAIGLGGGLTEKATNSIKLIRKSGGKKIIDVDTELESTSNVLMVQRGDTLFATPGWWPSWSEIGAVILLTKAIFKF